MSDWLKRAQEEGGLNTEGVDPQQVDQAQQTPQPTDTIGLKDLNVQGAEQVRQIAEWLYNLGTVMESIPEAEKQIVQILEQNNLSLQNVPELQGLYNRLGQVAGQGIWQG